MNGGYSQNARVLKGLFADKLPPRKPTLAEAVSNLMAAKALEDAVAANWHDPTDTSDIDAFHKRIDAEAALADALVKQGISRFVAEQMAGAL